MSRLDAANLINDTIHFNRATEGLCTMFHLILGLLMGRKQS